MGCLFAHPELPHATDGTTLGRKISVAAKPSSPTAAGGKTSGGESSHDPVSSYWQVTTHETTVFGKTRVLHMNDVVTCGPFGSGVVTRLPRPGDHIAEVTLQKWTLANGSNPVMYVRPEQTTVSVRRIPSWIHHTEEEVALSTASVAVALES